MSKTKKVVLIFISLVFITLGVICTIYSYQTDKLIFKNLLCLQRTIYRKEKYPQR